MRANTFQIGSSTPRPRRPASSVGRKGVVLLAVLVVLSVLTLAAYEFSQVMTAEVLVADSYQRAAQAHAFAESGVHYAAAVLSNPDVLTGQLQDNPYDNSAAFGNVLVNESDSARFQGRFSLIAPLGPDEVTSGSQGIRFGVLDECSKINVNAMMRLDSSGEILHDMLLFLPNMTEDIANSIIDWLDADDEAGPGGAESDVYATLDPPYRAKNGPIESLEELLLVRGITPKLLFGNDWNRNGQIDPDETDETGERDLGWSAYLTVNSRELNVDAAGAARIYVNDNDITALTEKLTQAVGEQLANYVIAYRVYGASTPPASTGRGGTGGQSSGGSSANTSSTGNSSRGSSGATGMSAGQGGSAGSTGAGTLAGGSTSAPASASPRGRSLVIPRVTTSGRGNNQPRSIGSLYDLINSQVSIPGNSPQAQPTVYPSPLNNPDSLRELLPLLLDKVTTVRESEIPARINVRTASRQVLLTLPGLDEADVQKIVDHRPTISTGGSTEPIYQTPAWLITEANLEPQKVRAIERYVTSRSQVYRVQSIGYFDGGGPTVRLEAVIDTNLGRPRIVHLRDLTKLGKGFAIAPSP